MILFTIEELSFFGVVHYLHNELESAIVINLEPQSQLGNKHARLVNSFDFCQPIKDVYRGQLTNESASGILELMKA